MRGVRAGLRGARALRAGLGAAALGVGLGALALGSAPLGAGPALPSPTPLPHDLHVVYADLGVEGAVIAGRLRFVKEDLERVVGRLVGADAVSLPPGPESEALVLRYLKERLRIEVDGAVLEAESLGSGEDEIGHHPAFWLLVQYRAPGPVAEVTVRNTLLFELHDDQRNELKLTRFPEESWTEVYFTHGEAERTLGHRGGPPGSLGTP